MRGVAINSRYGMTTQQHLKRAEIYSYIHAIRHYRAVDTAKAYLEEQNYTSKLRYVWQQYKSLSNG